MELEHARYSLPKRQTVWLTFLAPWDSLKIIVLSKIKENLHLHVTTILQFISYFISPLSMKTSASTISSSLTTIPPFIKMRSFWACKTTIKRSLAGEFHTHSCTCTKWNSSAKKTSCSQHGYYKTVSYKLWFKLSALISKNWTWNNRERIFCLHVVSDL